MTINPVRALRTKVSGAIDWRVDRAFDQRSPRKIPDDVRLELDATALRIERNTEEIAALKVLLADASSSLSDQNRALGQLVEQLERRIRSLES